MPATAVKRRSSRAARPRWHRRKDARPDEILAAALEVFSDRGFAATKLEDVARKAGVTKGTIYLYFENKEALFKALIRETIVQVIAQGEALAQSLPGVRASSWSGWCASTGVWSVKRRSSGSPN